MAYLTTVRDASYGYDQRMEVTIIQVIFVRRTTFRCLAAMAVWSLWKIRNNRLLLLAILMVNGSVVW